MNLAYIKKGRELLASGTPRLSMLQTLMEQFSVSRRTAQKVLKYCLETPATAETTFVVDLPQAKADESEMCRVLRPIREFLEEFFAGKAETALLQQVATRHEREIAELKTELKALRQGSVAVETERSVGAVIDDKSARKALAKAIQRWAAKRAPKIAGGSWTEEVKLLISTTQHAVKQRQGGAWGTLSTDQVYAEACYLYKETNDEEFLLLKAAVWRYLAPRKT